MLHTPIRKRVQIALLMIVLLASLLSSYSVQGQAGASNLFSDADTSAADVSYSKPAEVARYRYVSFNPAILPASVSTSDAAPELTLNLFADVNYTGLVKKVERSSIGTTWTGTLKGKARSYFYVVEADGVLIAHVGSTDGIYEVSWAADKLYRVIQIDQSQLKDHTEGAYENLPVGNVPSAADLGPTADSGATIDIMVVYSDDARLAEGNTPAIKARIALAVAETNTGYANAGVIPRLRLVHVEEFSYTEAGDMSVDLTRLINPSDGLLDSVHSLRNTYAADLVGLIVENGGGGCGIASSIMASAANAFQVTARNCTTGYYSFGHEFGHLQGARHDIDADPTLTPFSYGHGFTHPSFTPAEHWRTIMAYADNCVAVVGTDCTRLQYWSNNSVTFLGAAMGNAQARNFLVLNNTANTVANFRTQKIANNFNSSFNSNSAGWSPAAGAWALSSSAYYRSTGLANLFASAKRTGTYGDLTYEARLKRTGNCTSCSNHIIVRGDPSPLDPAKRWNKEYRFSFTNDGAFAVWEVSGASVVALQTWTATGAVVQNNWNRLKVIAVGKSLKFYINGTLVWSANDTTFKTGQVGFGFFRDGAAGTLLVDWAKLSTTPTADFNPFEQVAPSGEVIGGTDSQSN